MTNSFTQKVYDIVKNIPMGQVRTYKEVAQEAGRPRAHRAVGNILTKNYSSDIPCHRVVRSDGNIGGYNRGALEKERLLHKEGAL